MKLNEWQIKTILYALENFNAIKPTKNIQELITLIANSKSIEANTLDSKIVQEVCKTEMLLLFNENVKLRQELKIRGWK